MSTPPPLDLDALPLDDLKRLVAELLVRVAAQDEEVRALREENARLKGLPTRPTLAPGGMDKATAPDEPAKAKAVRRRKRKSRGGQRTPLATEERTLTLAVPPGSRRSKGYEPYTVQDLALTPRVIRYRRERWVTPDGQEVIAPLPEEVTGHFGPGVMRFVLMQHFQGQVTAERLLTQLQALGLRISKGQVIAILNQDNEAFPAEKDALLEAGLATARWVTVDDTAARHARTNQTTTHIGDERFAWFATRPSKSRLSFLELLRAGRPDYVINAAAEAYMVEHKVPEAVIATLLGHERRTFVDQAAWEAHLASLDSGGQRRTVTEAALVGAITERGLLSDTVIVSDDAGQFDVFTHALCWIHAERHLRRLVCVTEEQRRLLAVQRHLVWWYFRDLKAYKADPASERRAGLRQRFDRVFGRVTGFAALDDAVARIHGNKDELLVVLERPEIPLHTNGSERDIRCYVTKRKISGETQAEAGKQARDTFLSLLKTCATLGVSFWDYLGTRLKIPDAGAVPWLPDLIRQRAAA